LVTSRHAFELEVDPGAVRRGRRYNRLVFGFSWPELFIIAMTAVIAASGGVMFRAAQRKR
jgi:hypothetical protein